MVYAAADKLSKVLRVDFCGIVTDAEAQKAIADFQQVLRELPRGFRLLTDFSGLEQMDAACAPAIKCVMDMCNDHGVELIVRVIPDPHKDIGFTIMSLFHYRHDLRIVTCDTTAEAEKLLAV